MSSVTAILVAYNSEGVIANALRALAREQVARIIVVDNASKDDTVEIVAREFPSVEIIRSANNEGFGRANNIALEKVTTPYALLVNPDAVMGQGAVSALVNAAETYSEAAILAPQLLDEQGAPIINYKDDVFVREYSRRKYDVATEDMSVGYLSGAVMLWNMAHMRKVGFFDPAIFLYYEDDDIGIRTRAAGFTNRLVRAATAQHLQGASSGKLSVASEYFKQKHMVWSRIYLERKYHGERAAKKLARKLRIEYTAKALFYALTLNHIKFARHRGRLQGLD